MHIHTKYVLSKAQADQYSAQLTYRFVKILIGGNEENNLDPGFPDNLFGPQFLRHFSTEHK